MLGLLIVSQHIFACNEDQPAIAELRTKPGYQFKGPLSVAEIETKQMIEISETHQMLPFGYANADWLTFKASMQAGDQIYFMVSSLKKSYRDGYALVRHGCIVHFLLGTVS